MSTTGSQSVPAIVRGAVGARQLLRRIALVLASSDTDALFQMMDEREEAMSLERQHELGDDVAMDAGDHRRHHARRSIENERSAGKNRNAERSWVVVECRLCDDGEQWRVCRRDVYRLAYVVRHQCAVSERGERLCEALEQRLIRSDQQYRRHQCSCASLAPRLIVERAAVCGLRVERNVVWFHARAQ